MDFTEFLVIIIVIVQPGAQCTIKCLLLQSHTQTRITAGHCHLSNYDFLFHHDKAQAHHSRYTDTYLHMSE